MTSPPDGPVEGVAITFPGTTLRAGVAAPHAELVDAKTAQRDGQAGAAHEERRRLRMQNEIETQVAQALRAEAAAPAAPAASVDDIYAQLTKLGELRERGLLTEAEFAQQMARLLG